MSVRTCATVSSNDVTAAPFGLTICAIVKIVHFVSRTFVGVVIDAPRRRVRSHRDRESPKALGRAGASRAQRRASIDTRRARDGANGRNHRPARDRPHAPSGSSSQKLASRKGGSRSRRGRDFNRDGPNVRWFTKGRVGDRLREQRRSTRRRNVGRRQIKNGFVVFQTFLYRHRSKL